LSVYFLDLYSVGLPDLTISNLAGAGPGRILELKSGRIQIWGELVFRSQNNMPDETDGVNNAASCYKEAVQFGASFVMSLFASS